MNHRRICAVASLTGLCVSLAYSSYSLQDKPTITSSSSAVYYQGVYWNNFVETQHYMNALATDDAETDWQTHLLNWNNGKSFRNALILSCGNGFVERTLYDRGIIQAAVGIDVDLALLEIARTHADGKYPFKYVLLDSNKNSDFPWGDFDLVVNHAALHHIAYIDFHVRSLYRLLRRSGGTIVNYDYVGPHRNQYSDDHWNAIIDLNNRSHPCFRHPDLVYPHLPTMLSVDPSEAIHSELIVETLRRYFEPQWFRYLNGQLAYALLTHNRNLQHHSCHAKMNISSHVQWVLNEDRLYAEKYRNDGLFLYSIMTPRIDAPKNADLDRWSLEESKRENKARRQHGLYYGSA